MNKKRISQIGMALLLSFSCYAAYPANSAVSDTFITAKIKTKLAANNITNARSIHVKTNKGIVYLDGVVDSITEAATAVQMTEATDGVVDVNTDKLFVKNSTQPVHDSYITSKIKGLLIRENMLHGSHYPNINDVIVETKDGVVYLSGVVSSRAEKLRALDLAKSVDGVEAVKSAIKTRD